MVGYNPCKVVREMEREEDKIKQALLKKALGYSASETVEEFSVDEEGNKKLSKKKVTKKHFSPDISAVKVLLERFYKTYEERVLSMSDDELQEEKSRLEDLLKGEGDGN
ncbi:MAG: hypothetical protein IJY90_00725 [Clostridia bacterium]|nr:hypothetical protein [Clostridia bacterium]